MKVNCDIGERGVDHPVDVALMSFVDVANIACGGHAGDEESVSFFCDLARRLGVEVCAHLSYPDRENFGRVSLDLPVEVLLRALDEQFDLLCGVKLVKFHGALYHDSCRNLFLAEALAGWLVAKGVLSVITLDGSCLARACEAVGIAVVREAFAERRYCLVDGVLSLVSRSDSQACIEVLDEAVEQARSIMVDGQVSLVDGQVVPVVVDSVCVHSDSVVALELVKAIRGFCV